jgi:alanine transaminase
VEFCHRNGVLLMADEVYQENVYVKKAKPFVSFKKVVRSMGSAYDQFEMFSFHSISKGFVGE